MNDLSADPNSAPVFDPEAVGGLQRRAESGDLAAALELGERLFVGEGAPFDPRAGHAWIDRAAQAGVPGAVAHLATLTASGFLVEQDWERALDLLRDAAQAGSVFAQEQLRGLQPAVTASSDWSALRAQIAPSQWLTRPERRRASLQPRINIVENFAPLPICHWLIERTRGNLRPSMMYNGRRSVFLATRTCTDYVFDILKAGVALALLRARCAVMMGVPVVHLESPQVFHYDAGQEIKEHYDHIRPAGPEHPERIATLLMYLNHDYEGGHLEFPKVNFRYRGNTGDAVYFANVDTEGKADPLTLHAGRVVTSGEKWILSQWVQDRAFGTSV